MVFTYKALAYDLTVPGKLNDLCGWDSHGPALKDVNILLRSRHSNRARLFLAVFNKPNVEYLHFFSSNHLLMNQLSF